MNVSPEDLAAVKAAAYEGARAGAAAAIAEHASTVVPPADGATRVIATQNGWAFVQTPASQKYLPGEWLCCNLQLLPDAPGRADLTDEQVRRIALNVGCTDDGVRVPAAMRGFPSADTAAEAELYDRCSSTMYVYDVERAFLAGTPVWRLNDDQSMFDVMGVPKGKNYPVVHALRARSWPDVEDWCQRTRADRDAFDARSNK